MLKMAEMDENVTLAAQLEEESRRSVILINKFNVKPEDADNLLNAWAADAAYLKHKPGFISTQLHRGIGGSCVFINYASGSLLSILSMRLVILNLGQPLHIIQTVLLRHLISLGKLLYPESVSTELRQPNSTEEFFFYFYTE
jgi:hypothetical protein